MKPGHNSEPQPVIDIDQLASQLMMLDSLHSAASDGLLQRTSPLPEDALKAWLSEIQYLAGETLAEIRRHSNHRTAPQLRLLRTGPGRRRRPAI